MPVRHIEFTEYAVLFEEQIRRLDCKTQYAVLSRRCDMSYPTGGYGVLVGVTEVSLASALQVLRRLGSIFTLVYAAVQKLKKAFAKSFSSVAFTIQGGRCLSP
ncbi:hypothetical protein Tco_1000211 [Tanacetum coccineum]